MKFCEKLQMLRKEKGFSQEQLADLLEVSRQSVSKWESGTTYPEMDKLLALCKIFNVTLDDLTNDDITKKDIQESKKNNFSNFVYTIMDMFDRSTEMFKNMSSKEVKNCVIKLLLVIVLLFICKIPFNYLDSLLFDLLHNFSIRLYSLFSFIISIVYFLFFIITLLYFYKTRYLDVYQIKEKEEVQETEETEKDQEVEEKVTVAEPKKQKSFIVFDVLGGIFIFFLKFILFFVLIGICGAFIGLVFAFVTSVIALINGIDILGLVIVMFALVVGCGVFLDLGIAWLFSKKPNYKVLIANFLISLALLGGGCSIFAYEVTKFNYIDGISKNFEKVDEVKTIEMTDDLVIYNHAGTITYKENNDLRDSVNLSLSYYAHKGETFDFIQNKGVFNVYYNNNHINVNEIMNSVIKDLKDHNLYSYNGLFDIDIVVETSADNIEVIKKNLEAEEIRYREEFERESELEMQIDKYEARIEELESQNEILEDKVDELQDKIDSYKDGIKSIINE